MRSWMFTEVNMAIVFHNDISENQPVFMNFKIFKTIFAGTVSLYQIRTR